MAESVSHILAQLVPDEVDALLAGILGGAFRRKGDGGRFRITAVGAFRGFLTESLLAVAGHPRLEVALVVLDEESERVIHVHEGVIVGATSNVLFERLGRILYKNGVVTQADADTLVRLEEKDGAPGVIGWVPDDVLRWVVERRVEGVIDALPFVTRGHFLLVEGEMPRQGVPATALDPRLLAARARDAYDVWRRGSEAPDATEDATEDGTGTRPSTPTDVPAPLAGPLRPPRSREEEIQDILRRVREADIHLGE